MLLLLKSKSKNHFGLGKYGLCSAEKKSHDNLCCTGEFKKRVIKVNKDALIEYERLKQKDFFSTVKSTISDDTFTILFHNVRSLLRHHVDDIVSDDRIINNGITEFAETQINLSNST